MKKIALVTGGSSGIGMAISRKLVENGLWHVVSLSRSKEKIERAHHEFPEVKGKVEFMTGDVSDQDECSRMAHILEEKYGVLHGLVNNAGVVTWGGMEMISVEQWNTIIGINLNGPFMLTKAFLPLLKKAGEASIVNISSIASRQPGTSVAYSVSKAGLDMLTEYLAGDLGPYKIRVNSINPGLVQTNLHLDNKVFSEKNDYLTMLDKAVSRYPIGRIGKPSDIASLTSFLLSDEASWITGSIIKADGGTTLFNDLIPPKMV